MRYGILLRKVDPGAGLDFDFDHVAMHVDEARA